MLRAIVIDDEDGAIEMIKSLALRNANSIKIVAAALRAEEGIVLIEDYKPDVVFLDVSMPTMSGFELLSKLNFREFKLVFTTAHREYALEAIKNKAFDYLLKPINSDDFSKCVNDILHAGKDISSVKPNFTAFIEVQVKDGIVYIRQKDIIRLEASRSYTEIYLDNGQKHVASRSLGEFEPRLDSKLFYRSHKSHIINLQKVQKFVNHNGFFALMSDGSMPDISKNNKEEFLELLKNCWQSGFPNQGN
jgi:two-component system LytT family response regulator